ncbi:ATPase [Butyrivibrio sp. XB500-5]|uniref:xylulokinase n=1 Tax=Butyrivibrio sp. XB500-5 TaxID=2364880 RepID=UPI000EAA4292|nr:FGGY-family carbohydrate kinase [Butyrivibrio sp. XB500-5]RKM61734.1 ATPase [Butyrivibrio sp. XB500-5]
MSNIKEAIQQGKTYLGIEFGSTRIKAVLTDENYNPIASGGHNWENRLENGVWTYTLDDVWEGLKDCYSKLAADVAKQYDEKLTTVGAMGFSAMMHGYMAFDKSGELLVPFRTWRNTITGEASDILTEEFGYHIPQRWSIAHLYQAILNKEQHVSKVDFFTTLAGYVHWKLTGEKVIGVGDASGMFPIDSSTCDFNAGMLDKFDALIADKNFGFKIRDILPKVLVAGEDAGTLTEEGAKLLDPTGTLKAGISVCPPEGDAGTGMVATNSVGVRTGNISAGTSVFSMVVLEHDLSKAYPELDLVTTPSGEQVAMVHCNNCTSDLNAWVSLFREFAKDIGKEVDDDTLYGTLYRKAMEGDADCGGLLSYNYFSGESITGFDEGRPLFARRPDDKFNLSNFMRAHLYTALGALKIGNDILTKQENVKADFFFGQGGFFKIRGVGDRVMAAALDTPIKLMETAGEGGPWGQAILAGYMKQKAAGESLEKYLSDKVFVGGKVETCTPDSADVKGFDEFMKNYNAGLAIERAAVDSLK